MSTGRFWPTAAPASSVRTLFPRIPAKPNRRRQPRRTEDRESLTLAELAYWLLNRGRKPSFIIDEQMTVLLMNDAARDFLASTKAICMRGTKLEFSGDRPRLDMARILADKADHTSFTVKTARRPTTVTARRLPLPGSAGRSFMITMSPASGTDHELLQAQLGLTKAESEIALAIFQGVSLADISQQRRASINTVKTQVRYLFQKCDVHSQSGLTRRIAELLRGGDDDDKC